MKHRNVVRPRDSRSPAQSGTGKLAALCLALGLSFPQVSQAYAPRQSASAPGDARYEHRFPRVVAGFDRPVFVTHAGDTRLFVVEQNGLIRIVENGIIQATPFLSLTTRVRTEGAEEGLLGLAFEPQFANTKRFYVYYVNTAGDLQISRFQANSAGTQAVPTEVPLLTIAHPNHSNHNGGWLGFGPDNLLYIAVGDGGGGGDPDCAAENPNDLRGKILRIDVIGKSGYESPAANVFKPGDQRPEVFALGLRNPWRVSFDRNSGDLWLGDVGQNEREEISLLPSGSSAGANFGWSRFEGKAAYADPTPCSNRSGQAERSAVFDYPRSSGNSVTGGYVYRGAAYPAVDGAYYFADFGSRRLWISFRVAGAGEYSTVEISPDTRLNISSFGEDNVGELYALDYSQGALHKLQVTDRFANLAPRIRLPLIQRN
jgi:glucose/arabinose dehydrogenase